LKEVRVVRSPLRVVVEGHEGPVPRRARDYGLARNDSTPCGWVDLKEVSAVWSPLRVVIEGHEGPVPRRARDYGLARNDSTPCGCVV
jgi:hypothetical protein